VLGIDQHAIVIEQDVLLHLRVPFPAARNGDSHDHAAHEASHEATVSGGTNAAAA
jgi:hypothetical protein